MKLVIERVYRWCWRCQRWRSLGNFHLQRNGGRGYTCIRCWRPDVPHTNRRAGWVVTDKARAYLRSVA